MSRLGYIVVEYNQASGRPGLLAFNPMLHDDVADARDELAHARTETARVGRKEKQVIAEVVLLDEED